MNSIFKRTSIRNYLSQPVEPEKIQMLLKAAMAAPSAGNQQPWEFYVVENPKTIEKLAACSPYAGCLNGAPLAIVACARKEIRMPSYAEIDMSASVENLLLEAVELDLGAVWLGIAPIKERMEQVSAILNVPDSLNVFAIVSCGYPAAEKEQEDRFDENRIHYVK